MAAPVFSWKEALSLLYNLEEGVLCVDRKGEVLAFNSPGKRITGLSSVHTLPYPLKKLPVDKIIQEALSKGQAKEKVEGKINDVNVSGKVLPVGKPLENEIIFYIFQKRNICEELAEARRISRELNAIIDSSFDGIYITSPDGMTLRVNHAYQRITGIPISEFQGKNVHELVREGISNVCITPLVVKRKKPVTTTQLFYNGKTVIITGNPIFDDEGEVIRVVTNMRDVTGLYCLKEELDASKRITRRYQKRLKVFRDRVLKSEQVVVGSPCMRKILDMAFTLSQVDSTVLIQGRPGVGKGVIARLIHDSGPRRRGPFMKINCGSIPANLIEPEPFSFEPDAFTGVNREGRKGLLEMARGGTIFLDEVSDLSMPLQVKLLQVLQDCRFFKKDGKKSAGTNTRIIAASCKDLYQLVRNGLFQEDLYYYLNVVSLLIPDLRERREDIPELLSYYLERYCTKYGAEKKLLPQVQRYLLEYHWPGNVRELKNLVECLVVESSGAVITVDDLPSNIKRKTVSEEPAVVVRKLAPLKDAVEQVEKELIRKALSRSGSTYGAAKLLKVSQPTVFRKAKKYFHREKF